MQSKKMILGGTAVLLMLLAACSTTRLTGTWKDESLAGKTFQKFLIVGAAKDQRVRELFEDEFVRQLEAQGVKAIPSYTIIPAAKMLDRTTIASNIAEYGIDAVLITRLSELKQEREMDAGSTYQIPYAYYNQMHEYYKKGQEASQEISPLLTHKVLVLETNIYSADTEKLVWATAADIALQDTINTLTKDFIKAVVAQMVSDKII
jgi:hypothetical protein